MWGDEGRQWIEEIPKIIKAYEKKWHIKVQSPFELSYNYVAPAVGIDGSEFVIKIGFYKDQEFLSELKALELFKGQGVVGLIKKDKDSRVILLERVKPGKLLSSLNNDVEETKILAGLVNKINRPVKNEEGLIKIDKWRKELNDYCKKGEDHLFPLDLAIEAQELFDYLISTSKKKVLLHGDLHHDNVLALSDGKWIAIDPKGVLAEPGYEVAAMIRNPYKRLQMSSNLEDMLYKRIIILSKELGFDELRIYQWSLAQTVLSGVWCMETKEWKDHAIRVARSLKNISSNIVR